MFWNGRLYWQCKVFRICFVSCLIVHSALHSIVQCSPVWELVHWFWLFIVVYVYNCDTVKHFFRRVLISGFSHVENSLHFNLAVFPVNFIKHFISPSLSVSVPNFIIKIPIILFTLQITKKYCISRKCWYSMQINLWLWAMPKICVYLILILLKSQKFDAHEIYVFYIQ